MRTEMEEFLRLLEEASVVRVDGTGQYYLLRHPEVGWRLYQKGIEAAFLLAEGEKALYWAPEFRVPLPEVV
ncbi:hypothetical protein TthSNM17_24380 (plasmid) [Thermus thermophilus]|uniref:Uncharacterized protein n=2 Tax=Thermus TaxID=270 RepID=A0AAD1KWE3_THETH|nr:hypothetical protein TthAA11_23660 [Thermus thermophilus]BDG22776.1 hypothetical protein TthSNM17_24380 [Thermus thermophilus]BDG27770.1 hypothetical protein TthSNM66_24060 [Thermus thermophilus]BDG30274.1 hypothetical protein TthSNM76_24840 [Thermus thermophilus]